MPLQLSTVRKLLLMVGILFLGTGPLYAQDKIPTIKADTATKEDFKVQQDFEKHQEETSDPIKESEIKYEPATYPKDEFELDTMPPGNLVKVNPETGEKTVIEHKVPENLPDSGYTEGRKGTAAEVRGIMKEYTEQRKKGEDPTIQKFSPYKQVANPASKHNRKFVKIVSIYDNDAGGCSGTLVDEEWVLTAAHCVNMDKFGGDANEVRVFPGRHKGNKPYGMAKARNFYYFQNWDGKNNWNSDMAIIHLKRPVGVITGYYSFGYESKPFYSSNTFYTRNYPGEEGYHGNIMYRMSGTWDFDFKTGIFKPGAKRKKLAHNGGVVVGGSSGGGAYAKKNGENRVYAVVSHGPKGPSGNAISPEFYTRVTSGKHNEMTQTMQNNRPGPADLVALHTRLSKERITEGQELDRVTFTVFNRGTNYISERDWDYDIYLSDDQNIDRGDTHLGSYSFNGDFDGRETYRVWVEDLEIPLGNSGDKYIGVILDVSDEDTNNNNTEGWDSAELKVKKARTVSLKSDMAGGSSISDLYVHLSPGDLEENYIHKTGNDYLYPEGTEIYVDVDDYEGTKVFQQWNKDGSKISEDDGTYVDVDGDMNLTAIYHYPDVPLKPHSIGGRLPAKHTESDIKDTLEIVNHHSSTLDWTLSRKYGSSSWLSISHTSGSISPGSSEEVILTMSSDNLTKGGYSDSLIVSPDFGDPSKVKVELAVGPEPDPTAPSPDDIYAAQVVGEMMENLGFGMEVDIDDILERYFMGVGASGPTTQPGRVLVNQRIDGEWSGFTEVQPAETISDAQFGAAMDIFMGSSVPVMVGGAPGATGMYKQTTQETYSGRSVLFRYESGEWQEAFTLDESSLAGRAQFGASVESAPSPTDSDVQFVAVGAPGAANESGDRTGKVYVYNYILGDLAGSYEITPEGQLSNMEFGRSIDLITRNGRTLLLVGAPATGNSNYPGYAELFEYDPENDTWISLESLTANQAFASDHIGYSVALSWNEVRPAILLGAPGANENTGRIDWFTYTPDSETSWSYVQSITPDTEIANARFGSSLDLSRAHGKLMLMAGATGAGNENFAGHSKIYQLHDRNEEWSLRGTLRNSDLEGDARLGQAGVMQPVDGEIRYFASSPGADVEGYTDAGKMMEYGLPDPVTLPEVTLGRDSLGVTLMQQSQTPDSLEIMSTGESSLTWELENETPWVSVETDSGTISTNSSQIVNLNFNSAELDTGIYRNELVLHTNDMNQPRTTVEVSMRVTDKSTADLALSDMAATPDTLEAGTPVGENLSAQLFNQGTDPVDSTFAVGLYVSKDSVITDQDSLIATTRVDTGMAESEGTTFTIGGGALVPSSFADSDAHLILKADYENKVVELDEANNTMMKSVHIRQADNSQFTGISGFELHSVTLEESQNSVVQVQFTNTGIEPLSFSMPLFADLSATSKGNSGGADNIAATDTIPAYIENAGPATGSLAPQDTATITFTLNGEGVDKGTYNDTLSIVTNDPGQTTVMIPVEVTVETGTDIGDEQGIPEEFALKNNYPNPFNPSTQISYALPEESRVKLEVYNNLGRNVQTLVNERQSAGQYNITFEAGNLPSGLYIYRIKAGNFSESNKMLLIK